MQGRKAVGFFPRFVPFSLRSKKGSEKTENRILVRTFPHFLCILKFEGATYYIFGKIMGTDTSFLES